MEAGAKTSTKDRILDAAELLFADQGFEGTSMREITTEAGVNLAAVNYHFGSKERLLEAVVRRITDPVNEEQLRLLDELEAEKGGAGGGPSVEELVEVQVSPLVELLKRDEERGQVVSRLVARILADTGGRFQKAALTGTAEEVEERYFRSFSRALPHLSLEELRWRFRSAVLVVAFHRAPVGPTNWLLEARPETEQDVLAWMVTFLTAALRAPASQVGDRLQAKAATARD